MWDVGSTPYGTWGGMPCGMCGGMTHGGGMGCHAWEVGWDAIWEVGWDAIRWDVIMGHEVGPWDIMWDMGFYRLRKYSNLLSLILSQEKIKSN